MGLAVGDAIGTTLEFKRPGSFQPITDMVGGGPFRLKPGQWTDDTSMALCLAESLIECRGFEPADQMVRYLRWYREGHFGFLEAALWAFDTTDTFDAGCLRAVNLGDDADTTGAVYGQLAGAYYGLPGIRKTWVEKTALKEKILALAESLLAASRSSTASF